jgi:hypothetical protein
MEGWRQGRLGSKEDHSTTKGNYKTDLTLTGLLMEGLGRIGLTGGALDRCPRVNRLSKPVFSRDLTPGHLIRGRLQVTVVFNQQTL